MINSLTLETLLTAIGENPEDEDKNNATTIATFEKIVAIFAEGVIEMSDVGHGYLIVISSVVSQL